MKLISISSNETVVSFSNGTEILFSYNTPVAGRRLVDGALQIFKTNKKWSVTTSKHINKYLNTFIRDEVAELSQEEINSLGYNIKGVQNV